MNVNLCDPIKRKTLTSKTAYQQSISKLFSPTVVDLLAENNLSQLKEITSAIIKSGLVKSGSTFFEAAEVCYSYMTQNYKNEYIYRNIIFQHLVMENHSFDECIAIPEFRVGSSKADLAVFNGTSTVYEIKTELDTINRLKSQLEDYHKFFDHIYIVTHEGFLSQIMELASENVGIYILSENGNLDLIRKAQNNKSNVCKHTLMSSLRKNEYSSIIAKEFGSIPDVPNTKFYTECKSLFLELPVEVAHDSVVKALFSRKMKDHQINLIESMPACLRSVSLTKRYSQAQCKNITKNLGKKLFV